MSIIQIHDLRPERRVLAVDLRDMLDILAARALRSSWLVVEEVHGEPITTTGGKAADRLEELSRSGQRVPGDQLRQLARQVMQIIWGEFRGFEGPSQAFWIIIRAIDSTYYEIETDEEEVLQLVRRTFKDVREGDRRSKLRFL